MGMLCSDKTGWLLSFANWPCSAAALPHLWPLQLLPSYPWRWHRQSLSWASLPSTGVVSSQPCCTQSSNYHDWLWKNNKLIQPYRIEETWRNSEYNSLYSFSFHANPILAYPYTFLDANLRRSQAASEFGLTPDFNDPIGINSKCPGPHGWNYTIGFWIPKLNNSGCWEWLIDAWLMAILLDGWFIPQKRNLLECLPAVFLTNCWPSWFEASQNWCRDV